MNVERLHPVLTRTISVLSILTYSYNNEYVSRHNGVGVIN